jgi:hypothetical protein
MAIPAHEPTQEDLLRCVGAIHVSELQVEALFTDLTIIKSLLHARAKHLGSKNIEPEAGDTLRLLGVLAVNTNDETHVCRNQAATSVAGVGGSCMA